MTRERVSNPLHRQESPDTRASAYTLLCLAWLIYFCFGAGVFSLVPIVSQLRSELSLSYTEIGVILGGWQLVYIFAAIPAGSLIDRIGAKNALTLGATIMAGSMLLRSAAQDFNSLFLAVAPVGIGGPLTSAGLPKFIAEWFRGRDRAIASGIYMTGAIAGGVFVIALSHPVLLPFLGSWRTAHFFYGTVTAVAALTWAGVGRDRSVQSNSLPESQEANLLLRGYLEIAMRRDVQFVLLVAFAAFLASHGFQSWLPYILRIRGYDPSSAGYLGSLPSISGIAGSLVVLWFAGLYPAMRHKLTVTLLLMSAASIAVFPLVDNNVLLLVILLQGFSCTAITPLILNTLMEIPEIGARNMGRSSGLLFTAGEMGGALGPAILGRFADIQNSFGAGLMTIAAILVVAIIPAVGLETCGKRRQ